MTRIFTWTGNIHSIRGPDCSMESRSAIHPSWPIYSLQLTFHELLSGGRQNQPFPTAVPSPIREISESVKNFKKNYSPCFQYILPAWGKHLQPLRYAESSESIASQTIMRKQRKGELGFSRAKKSLNLGIFRKTLQWPLADTETKRLKRHPKFTPQRVESSFNVHSAPKAAAAVANRPLCRNQRKSGPPAAISRGAVQSRGRQPAVLARKRTQVGRGSSGLAHFHAQSPDS